MGIEVLQGDCRAILKLLPSASVHCIVTSPPYFGLRDYGVDGQMGLEPTPSEYLSGMVEVFREARRVLRDDGTLWLNMGDSYVTSPPGNRGTPKDKDGAYARRMALQIGHGEDAKAIWSPARASGLPNKSLLGMPWRLAFALQNDGWILRQDIIWHKPNPMPESIRDRCTKAHEYIFMFSKKPRYYFDTEAIKEPAVSNHASGNGFKGRQGGANHMPMSGGAGTTEEWLPGGLRNRRSVWTITTKPFKEAHFAVFPPDLVEPCILAGCPEGGTVLDPFFGAGTTGLVAERHGRNAIGIELNPEYVKIAQRRLGLSPMSELTNDTATQEGVFG